MPVTKVDLLALSDADLRVETASRIHAATIMLNSRWAKQYDDACTEAYRECDRRNPRIYALAWNDIARSQGIRETPVPERDQ